MSSSSASSASLDCILNLPPYIPSPVEYNKFKELFPAINTYYDEVMTTYESGPSREITTGTGYKIKSKSPMGDKITVKFSDLNFPDILKTADYYHYTRPSYRPFLENIDNYYDETGKSQERKIKSGIKGGKRKLRQSNRKHRKSNRKSKRKSRRI